MNRTKSMGIGSMFVVLVVAVVLLPMIVGYIDKLEPHFAGFENEEVTVPSIPPTLHNSNTKYLCRSPNDSGVPCKEGDFCDADTQACITNYPHGFDAISGYNLKTR